MASINTWLTGLVAIAVFGGAIAALGTRQVFWWLGGVRQTEVSVKLTAFTVLHGVVERVAVALIVLVNLNTAITFSIIWIGLKLASGWNRPDRPGADSKDEKKWERVRGALSTMGASLVSVAFGIWGGLHINGYSLPCT